MKLMRCAEATARDAVPASEAEARDAVALYASEATAMNLLAY